jgi:hypothetical protein
MREYAKRRRREDPAFRARQILYSRIYDRALAALRDSYPDEFDKLLVYYREHPDEVGGGAA